jgi:hypothetical protein
MLLRIMVLHNKIYDIAAMYFWWDGSCGLPRVLGLLHFVGYLRELQFCALYILSQGRLADRGSAGGFIEIQGMSMGLSCPGGLR